MTNDNPDLRDDIEIVEIPRDGGSYYWTVMVLGEYSKETAQQLKNKISKALENQVMECPHEIQFTVPDGELKESDIIPIQKNNEGRTLYKLKVHCSTVTQQNQHNDECRKALEILNRLKEVIPHDEFIFDENKVQYEKWFLRLRHWKQTESKLQQEKEKEKLNIANEALIESGIRNKKLSEELSQLRQREAELLDSIGIVRLEKDKVCKENEHLRPIVQALKDWLAQIQDYEKRKIKNLLSPNELHFITKIESILVTSEAKSN